MKILIFLAGFIAGALLFHRDWKPIDVAFSVAPGAPFGISRCLSAEDVQRLSIADLVTIRITPDGKVEVVDYYGNIRKVGLIHDPSIGVSGQ